jgi:hypothetical protein
MGLQRTAATARQLDLDIDEPEPESDGSIGHQERNDTGVAQLIPPAFLRQVHRHVTEAYSGQDPPLHTELRGYLCKFWFGPDEHIHYEIWVHSRTDQLEMGLHCESTAEYNRALYAAFDRCLLDIQQQLGSQLWLEEWDHGWARLYETHPLLPLDDVRVEEIAARICEIIAVLQPMYEEAASGLSRPSFVPARARNRSRHTRR